MLELKNIKKDYPAGGGKVVALKGIDLKFRDSEFVSILGPSGCGKTTTLNIIGGLDKYTSGDLIINTKSTKAFRDRDWDSYRNHSVGFVFQTYNLIPHQSVLQNVELALSLSGVSKNERRRRAKEALARVGLSDQLRKKPGEMSGGQMQRVAIARAIVNNPDIILADEPTGALDTQTSLQVMEILKEISKERLVIMVTHNPELAATYSTRIIKMLDGEITSDSNPISDSEAALLTEKHSKTAKKKKKAEKKPSLSFATSFALSLKNLFTKKGRTALTAFAGSIGIIGIALIFAVSQGMTGYINTVQEETLSSYPLTIEDEHTDITSILQTFMGSASAGYAHENDAVYQKSMMYDMINSINSMEADQNDLKAFKSYLEQQRADQESALYSAVNGVGYTYDMDMPIYTKNETGKVILSDSQVLMQDIMREHFGMDMSGFASVESGGMMGEMMNMSPMASSAVLWQEMLAGDNGELINDMLFKQYDLVHGSWPNSYNEIVLVVDEHNEIDDFTLYALGLLTKEQIDEATSAALKGEEIEVPHRKWAYKDILAMEFRTVLPSACFSLDPSTGLYTDLRETDAGLRYLYENGIPLKVSGIIRVKEDSLSEMLTGSICYTSALTDYIIRQSEGAAAISAQEKAPDTDIFTGLPFKENTGKLTNEQKQEEFKKYIEKLSDDKKAEAYIKIMSIPSAEDTAAAVEGALSALSREDLNKQMTAALVSQMGMNENDVRDYIEKMSDEEIKKLYGEAVEKQYKAQYAAGVSAQMSMLPKQQRIMLLEAAIQSYTPEQCAVYYEEILEFSDSTYNENMRALGLVDLDSPSSINLYASSFEAKDEIEAAISKYNEGVEEMKKIKYTDYVGLMMSSVTSIINAITYVLVAFVAVSLIVSSIMIGVITLISVQERTKEIGILRAIGASKKNVAAMFNAETMIIGFTSGLLGVAITYLLCIPINMILHALTGIGNLSAYLPWQVAVALIVISVLLTLISGIIPSRSAAKKDPVVALRSE